MQGKEDLLVITEETQKLIDQASKVYEKHFELKASFERAIFVSWYCSVGDCTFCYMSTQKEKIADPKTAKRHIASILAEIYICKLMDWDIEFISAGFTGVTPDELTDVLKYGSRIYGQKFWLNTGFMPKTLLEQYKPYLEGVSGSIETINPVLHKQVCPSKPIAPYIKLFDQAEKHELKKSMTIIVGLGETKDDIQKTIDFIKEHKLDRLTIYALRPVQGTAFTKAPPLDYYLEWIARLRIALPKLPIIAGIWHNKIETIQPILDAGANSVTKFPSIKGFGTNWQKQIKGRTFKGNFHHPIQIDQALQEKIRSDLEILENQELASKTEVKVLMYLKMMEKKGKDTAKFNREEDSNSFE